MGRPCTPGIAQARPKVHREILNYLRERIAVDANARRFGKPLTGEMAGLWRHRIRDYRLICRIEDDRVVVPSCGQRTAKTLIDDRIQSAGFLLRH